jgi:hypothetical protein
VSLKVDQTDKHVRFGLANDNTVGYPDYSMALFPSGRIWIEASGVDKSGTYTTASRLEVAVVDGNIVALLDGALLWNWGAAPSSMLFAKVSLYEEGCSVSGIALEDQPPAPPPALPASCKHTCDVSGAWVDGTGTQVGLVTDAVNLCSGSEEDGAWTYTVKISASGTTITLSDGTVGTVEGSAPARTISWSNGITYTEQPTAASPPPCKNVCDMSGSWVDGTGAQIGLAADAANPCTGSEGSGA